MAQSRPLPKQELGVRGVTAVEVLLLVILLGISDGYCFIGFPLLD